MIFTALVGDPRLPHHLEPGPCSDRFMPAMGRAIASTCCTIGSNTLLLAMGALLTARFIQTLSSLEDLNRTLETRVADRERALAANYERLAALEREHAASEERQLIMRDLHDGLGSQLFTSLSRVERGDMDDGQIATVAAQPASPTCGSRSTRWPPTSTTSAPRSAISCSAGRRSWSRPACVRAGTSTCRDRRHAAVAARRAAAAARGAGGADQRAQARAGRREVAGAARARGRRLGDGHGFIEMEVEDNGHGPGGRARRRRAMAWPTCARAPSGWAAQLDLHSAADGTCVVLRLPMTAPVA